jgi:hypothetical protein
MSSEKKEEGPAPSEPPPNLVLRLSSTDDQVERIRAIFDLSGDDPLPGVNVETLRAYCRYLTAHLSFPFEARFVVDSTPLQQTLILVTVMGLIVPEEEDEAQGIACEALEQGNPVELVLAGLEATGNAATRQLLEDYACWFRNGTQARVVINSEWLSMASAPSPPSKRTLVRLMFWSGIWGAILGIPLGALLAAMELVQVGAMVGAGLFGFIGYLAGSGSGMLVGALNQSRRGALYGSILGTLVGTAVGAYLGAMLGAMVGIVIGGLLGGWISGWFVRGARRLVGLALGAVIGATTQAFFFDAEKALEGAMYGAAIGAVVGAALVPAILGVIALMGRSQKQ